ncbi:MAG: hypothetical protein JXO51_07300 [Candidatus Aminicenantes bacterium]|nr:hypothetical protein [Candidatus Aminicenantes bacterium]
MAKKKWLTVGSVFLLFLSLPAAEWQRETAARILEESGYPQLVESLQRQFPELGRDEQAAVSLIIGYCQSRAGNPQAELFWMNKYLGEFRADDVKLGFLPASARQKIQRFRQSWRKDFPVLWELAPVPEQAEVAFFDPPKELRLRLQASLPCDFQLLARDGAPLARGVLGQDVETVSFPLAPDFFRVASHHFRLLLTLRSAPEKTVEKYFTLELEYVHPPEVLFDPLTAEVRLEGREVQPESRSETRVISQRTRFDKELFKKTVLKELLVGAGFFVVNATLFTSTIDNPDTSLFAKSALFGTRRAFTLAGIAFGLSALRRVPKLFKRERVVEEAVHDLPEAREANEALRRDLEVAARQVRVRLALKAL